MLHKRIHADSPSIENIRAMPLKKLSLEEKMKIINEYLQNTYQNLTPIPEEIEKCEKNQSETKNSNKINNSNQPNSNHNLENIIESSETDSENEDFNQKPILIKINYQNHVNHRMEYFVNKTNARKILDSINSKQNISLPTRLLYKSVSLSSLIDTPSNSHCQIRKSQSICNLNKQCQRKNSSLASDPININLRVLNNSISLGRSSSSNLHQSKSYFSCSKFQSGSSLFLDKIEKCQNLNPLIKRTKSKIKTYENSKLNEITSVSFINQKSPFTHRKTFDRFTPKKSPINEKSFNQKFKL